LAGHGRYKALESMGVTQCVVLSVRIADDAADLYTIADNKHTEMASWDFTRLADLLEDLDRRGVDTRITGIKDEELVNIMTWTPPPELPTPFTLMVNCKNPEQRERLKKRLDNQGYETRNL